MRPTFGEGDDADLRSVVRLEIAGGEMGAHAQHEAAVSTPWLLVRIPEEMESLPPVRQRKDLWSSARVWCVGAGTRPQYGSKPFKHLAHK